MKNFLLLTLLFGFVITHDGFCYSEKRSEKITKTLKFSTQSADNLLILKNVNGSVKVEGYNGTDVQVEATRTISARNDAKLQQGWDELKLVFSEEDNRIYIYLDAPFIEVKKRSDDIDYNIHNDGEDYWYQVEFLIKVPQQASLNISTINEGNVAITQAEGKFIEASNINGDVILDKIKGNAQARTVNGEIDVEFLNLPTEDLKFNTINGDIHVEFPKNLSADIYMKTMNGEFYTDFPDVTLLPGEIKKNAANHRGGTEFKIDKKTGIRIGKGGTLIDFHTLNGNIYIKQNN